MEMERLELRQSVRREYKVLLRIEAELLLPVAHKAIRAFYETLWEQCLARMRDGYGEQLLLEYDAIEDLAQRARIRTQVYRFRMRVSYEDDLLIAMLCESVILGRWSGPGDGYIRLSHVWNKNEELMLPPEQILSHFGIRLRRRNLPFQPDGIYPDGKELVFFRNITAQTSFMEKKLELFASEALKRGNA